jgi:hypothetical protein
MTQYINPTYPEICSLIPEFMNSLYNDDSLNATDLKEIRDAFRVKQMQGKVELLKKISELVNKDSNILLIGSWIGFTSFCLYKLGYNNVHEVDPDSRLNPITNHLNRFNKNFKHFDNDVNNIDISSYTCIVNTSCEHISDNRWFDSINHQSLIFLQSTDYQSWDHTNTCNSIQDMISKYPLDNILYANTLELQTYNRFFLVGTKINN